MSDALPALSANHSFADNVIRSRQSVGIELKHLLHGHLGPIFLIDREGALYNQNASAGLMLEDALCWQTLQRSSLDVLVDNQPLELELITTGEPKRCFSARAFPVRLNPDETLVLWTAVETSLKDHLIAALKDSRMLFRDLAEAAGDFCIEVDTNGHFGYVSPTGALGYEAWALNDQPVTLWGPTAMAMVSQTRVGPLDLWLIDRHGDTRCIVIVTAPIMRDEQWLGSRIIARDVTAERDAAAELERANRREGLQLAVLAAARDQFDGQRMIEEALDHIRNHFTADACELTNAGKITTVGDFQPSAHALSAPCRAHGKDIGLIRLWRNENTWADADTLALDTVADTVALVAAQGEHLIDLNRKSKTDALTGLANRRAFNEEMQRHLAKLVRHGGTSTLLLIDIDHFKTLNDTLGHLAGDQALVAVATLLRETVRDTDLPARLGGDEFVVWLDNTTVVGAERVARALQKGIRKIRDSFHNPTVPLSLSIGMAAWEAPIYDLQILMKRADEALYDAKRSGKACMKAFGNKVEL